MAVLFNVALILVSLLTLQTAYSEVEWDNHDMFCCQHGDECISMDLVCDGKADCPLGSDEGNRCRSASLLYWSSQEVWLTRFGETGVVPRRIMRTPGKIGHVTVGMHQGDVYWSDLTTQAIKAVTLRGQPRSHINIQGFKDIQGMSFDWLLEVLFVIDGGRRELLACPVEDAMCSVVLRDLHKPRAVAVDPFKGRVYWADLECGIEASRLDGSEQTILVPANVSTASSLSVDVLSGRIFWVDTELSLVWSMASNGTDLKMLMEFHMDLAPSLTVGARQVFWLEIRDHSDIVMVADKWTGGHQKAVVDVKRDWLQGIQVIHPALQEHEWSVCEQTVAECSHLCVPGAEGQPACLCPSHLQLAPDGITCTDRPDAVMLMVVSSSGLLKVYPDSVGSSHSEPVSVEGLQTVSALTYNPVSHMAYLCDPFTDHIYTLDLKDNTISPVVNGSVWSVRSIGVDWISSHLYWLNTGQGVIEASQLDGSSRVVLIQNEMDTLTSLVVAPLLGSLFYSVVGVHSHIEQCNLAATSCHELRTEPDDPYLLTLDEETNILYWAEQKHEFIKASSVTVSGANVRIVIRHAGKPLSMVVNGGVLYWTQQESWAIHYASAVDGTGAGSLVVGDDRLGALLLANPADNSGHDFCQENNGGCSHLCFTTPVGRICACPTGMVLIPDNNDDTCQPSGLQSNVCGPDRFTCQLDLDCIPLDHMCDGVFQCIDKSDEDVSLCQGRLINNDQSKCGNDHYTCSNGDCVALSDACDGHRDCRDGSDEGLLCERACKDNLKLCHHLCVATPYGPRCMCPPGYTHLDDEYSCQDIDECKMGGSICSQICINLPGNFTCACKHGYKLEPDGATCKATGKDYAEIIIARGNRIHTLPLKSGRHNIRDIAMATQPGSIMAVAIDIPTGDIYWALEPSKNEDPRVSHIEVRSHKLGEVKSLMVLPALVHGLAMDWVTGNLYITDMKHHTIWVCQMTTRWCLQLVSDTVYHPRALALDPIQGLMFYAGVGTSAMIEKAWMNGEHQEVIVSQHVIYPTSITVDLLTQQLYWVDAHYDTIETVSYTGLRRKVLYYEHMSHPLSIQVFESKIYWSDQMSQSISSINKAWGDNYTVLYHSDLPVSAIAVVHLLKQPYVRNRCLKLSCSHLCLLTPDGATCRCPQCWRPLQEDPNKCLGPEEALPIQDLLTGLIECPRDRCFNGSLCVPQDVRAAPCSCPGGFSGIRCDNRTGIVVPYPILAKSSYIWVAGVLCVLVLSILTVFGAIYCCRRRRLTDGDVISIIRFRSALLGEDGGEVQADTEGLVNSSFENPGFTVVDDENANCSSKVPMITSPSDDSLDSAFISRRDSMEGDTAWDTRPLTKEEHYDSS